VLAFLQALPGLISLVSQLLKLLLNATKEDPGKAIADTHNVIQEVKNAKTTKEKQAAAKRLADLISG